MPRLTPKNQQDRRGSGQPSGAAPGGSRLASALAAKGSAKAASTSPSKGSNRAQGPSVTQARSDLAQTAREASGRTSDSRLRAALQLKATQVLEPQDRDTPLWAKALSTLDLPRAVVFSTLKEASDALGDGDASLDDLVQQAQDHRGFGDIEALKFNEGDAWWQRGLKATGALAGDIATDPLTYLTLGTSSAATKGASMSARLGTAGRAVEKGLSDAAVTSAAKKGVVGLSRAERAAAGFDPLAVRFAGRAIPGTEGLAEGLSEVGAALRTAGGGSRAASIGRKFKHAPDEMPFIEKIVGRGADDATRVTAAKGLSAIKAQKGASRQFVDEANRGLTVAYKQVTRNGVKDDAIAALVEAGDTRAQPLIDWLKGVRAEAVKRGVDIGALTDYHPHRITKEFREKLAESDRLQGQFASKLDAPESPQLMRKYVPGEDFMGVTLKTGSIDEINQIARATAALGVDVFEKSSGKVLPAYAESLGRAVGKVRAGNRLEQLLAAKRIGRAVTQEIPGDERLAEAAAQAAAGAANVDDLTSRMQQTISEAYAMAGAGAPEPPEFQRAITRLAEDNRAIGQGDRAASMADAPAVDHVADVQATIDEITAEIADLTRANPRDPRIADLADAQNKAMIARDWLTANPNATAWERRVVGLLNEGIYLGVKAGKARWDQEAFERFASNLRQPHTRTVYVNKIDDGMARLSKDLQAEPWLVDAMTASTKMRDEQSWRELTNAWDKVQNYIKSWQVATPGFVVRNTYGGMWNNYAAYNVGPRDYVAFISAHKRYRAAAKAGRDWSKEVDEHFAQALEAASASGAGQTADEVRRGILDLPAGSGTIPGAQYNVLSNKGPYIRALRGAGEDVEIFMRGALAHKVIRQGGTLDEAIQAVERVHFNYRDITQLDRAIKRVVPYWVFTSRNLPLQLDLMAHHPQKFLNAVRAKEAIEDDSINAGEVTPNYLDDVFGGKVGRTGAGDSVFLTPDLPFVRLGEEVDNLSDAFHGDAAGLLNNVTPIIKAPIEAGLGVQAYTGQPFVPGRQVPLWFGESWLGPAMAMSGRANRTEDGGWMISEKDSYLLEQYVPLLGRVRRMAPNQPKYQSRVNTTWLSFLGLSVRTNTDNAQWGEIARQQKELDGWLTEQQDLGFIKPRRRR